MVLVKCLDFAGRNVKGEHRGRVEIVTRVGVSGPGRGVADAPIDGLRVLVVVAGHPGGAATLLPIIAAPRFMAGFTLAGNGEGTPQFLAVIGIERRDVAAYAELAAGAADEHLAVDHERHQSEILTLLVVLNLGIPEHL